MVNSDEQVSKFVQAITDYAKEQREKILQEVEEFKTKRLQQAEQEVLMDAYRMIQKEQQELQNKASREMSRRELEARKKLLGKRRGMMDEVFAQAREELEAYAALPAYAQALEASLRTMAQTLPAEGTVYAVAPKDEDKLAALSALCPPGSRVEVSAGIQLGGLLGENRQAGLRLDDTLDTKLELQREWFTENSGLTVE